MSADDLAALIAATRRAFQALKGAGDALHADLGVTASTRALLEHLDADGPETVPAIARAKLVTRQHIQQIADAAIAAGLVETQPNPAHKRSALLALTAEGETTFAAIRAREAVALAELAAALEPEFSGEDLARAAAVLSRLTGALAPSTYDEEGD